MATTNILLVDIRLMLGRLRPASAYHWKGDGDFGNTMEAIGDWHDAETVPPTEADILAEWDIYLVEQQAEETAKAAAQADLDSVKSSAVQAALDSIETDLAALAAASLAETKQIIGRMLVRQRLIIKAVRHLVDKE